MSVRSRQKLEQALKGLIPPFVRLRLRGVWKRWIPRLRIYLTDAANVVRFGAGAPRMFQTLWVPAACIVGQLDLKHPDFLRAWIGGDARDPDAEAVARKVRASLRRGPDVIRPGDWDRWCESTVHNTTKSRIATKFDRQLGWREAGFYRWMEDGIERRGTLDGCATPEDVQARYAVLERIARDCESGLGLATQQQIKATAFREDGGIAVVVDRRGGVVFAGAGNHRLFIAQYFALDRIPVCVCAVHPACVRNGTWAELVARSRLLGAGAPGRAAGAVQGQAAG